MTILSLSETSWQKDEIQASFEYALEARELSLNIDDELGYAKVLLIISRIQIDLENYQKSTDFSYEALKKFDKYQDKKGMGNAFTRFGFDVPKRYDAFQQMIEESIPCNITTYDYYHGLMVEHAKEFCNKSPKCENCPLTLFCRKLV